MDHFDHRLPGGPAAAHGADPQISVRIKGGRITRTAQRTNKGKYRALVFTAYFFQSDADDFAVGDVGDERLTAEGAEYLFGGEGRVPW